ncbi:MAG: TonB-dependent receptor [Candidatus Aminicenantales bacterium]
MSVASPKPFFIIFLTALLLLAGRTSAGAQTADSPDKNGSAQNQKSGDQENKDTQQAVAQKKQSFDITVTAPRVEIPLKANPAATTVVETPILQTMSRTIAADEAMKLVPGVKVDNQADGERVHLSIRGQGILTERGTRGITTLVDGIPLNDPSGFVADFFDIDWATVSRIEVLRGPAAAFYGSGSSGGILNILTRDGGPASLAGRGTLSGGSFGFFKGQAEAGGTIGPMNYRVSGSGISGQGYRDQTKYWADNFYGKFHFNLAPAVKLTAVLGWTDFFNQNAEGLNLDWFSANPSLLRRKANPDAYAFNEYQRTSRYTGGLTGSIGMGLNLDLALTAYFRHTKYTESVPSSVIHRGYDTPGFSLQVNHRAGEGWLKNHLSAGVDLSWQTIDEYKRPNLGQAVEGPGLLSDQAMSQTGAGVFLLERLELGPRWGASLSLRYDKVTNRLDDHFRAGGIDLSGNVSFERATGRAGLTWNPASGFGLYASWGTGFLPPGTEELVNNPYALGGYNSQLISATLSGEEIGARGAAGPSLIYDVAFFHLATEHDFGRYRMSLRPLETFYGNVGSTTRYGLEAFLAWYPLQPLALRLAYTYSHFKYDAVQTLDAGVIYNGTWLPNSPQHQAYLDGECKITPSLLAGASLEYVSSWYIDSTNRIFPNGYGRTDPYALVHVRLSYKFTVVGASGEVILSGRNIFGVEYYGFTEPDPDGNSYQPAATAEWSLRLRLGLGRVE